MNMTSVQLLKPDAAGDADIVIRELWVSRQTAVTSVVISEHGNARGVVQFDVVRVCSLVSYSYKKILTLVYVRISYTVYFMACC